MGELSWSSLPTKAQGCQGLETMGYVRLKALCFGLAWSSLAITSRPPRAPRTTKFHGRPATSDPHPHQGVKPHAPGTARTPASGSPQTTAARSPCALGRCNSTAMPRAASPSAGSPRSCAADIWNRSEFTISCSLTFGQRCCDGVGNHPLTTHVAHVFLFPSRVLVLITPGLSMSTRAPRDSVSLGRR